MARTGISIKVSNTNFGSPPQVNGNSMLVVVGATAASGGTLPFTLDTPYLLRSVDDLEQLGITVAENPDVYNQVSDYFSKTSGILWLVGTATNTNVKTNLVNYVRATVAPGFEYRPRQILISNDPVDTANVLLTADVQTVIEALYEEGFSTVAIKGGEVITGAIATAVATLPDLSTGAAPMVGVLIGTNRQGDRPCVGLVGGLMASLSVGTSIGDVSLAPLGNSFYVIDGTIADDEVSWINTPCSALSLDTVNALGDKQYLFPRTRSPKNGLWLNDGATAADAATALSTLEASRTIASIVDDLRLFFTPYINGKVPVNAAGDIRSDYKQVVLDNCRAKVVTPYVQNGDISDARIQLNAKNDDMVGTRTWEVTLGIQPASTLRWIDGYVFYVKSL